MRLKKKSHFISVWVLVGLLFGVFSCQKTDTLNPQQETAFTVNDKDLQIQQKILKFKERIAYLKDNPAAKDAGTISVDDALWNLEADLNYTYGRVEDRYEKYIYDLSTYTININTDGTVNETDVSNTYGLMLGHLSSFFWDLPYENKKFVLADLKIKSITNDLLTIDIKATAGIEPPGPTQFDPFGEDDYWMWGEWLGQIIDSCDGYINAVVSDAAEEIEERLASFIYVAPPGFRVFYTEQEGEELEGNEYENPDDDVPFDNNYDYLQFYCSASNSEITRNEECLDPDEMDFYYYGTKTVVMQYDYERPEGKNLVSIDIIGKGDNEYINNNPIFRIRHHTIVNYGIRHVVPDGGGTAIDLPPVD